MVAHSPYQSYRDPRLRPWRFYFKYVISSFTNLFHLTDYILTKSLLADDILMLSVLSRTAFAAFLHTTFEIPLFVVIMSIAIDSLSLWTPLRLVLSPEIKSAPVVRVDIKKDTSLTFVLTLIVSSILSIAVYVIQKTTGPATLLAHFDQVRSITASPLPLLLLAFLPAGYCLQGLIDKYGWAGMWAALSSAALVGASKIGLGIRGGDLLGTILVVQYWNTAMLIASSTVKYVLQI